MQKEKSYRIYVTDALYCSVNGGAMSERYIDLIEGSKEKDERTGDEIARDIIERLGLEVGD